MLLTLTTTHRPATDLGFLLAKHPARVQSFNLAFGQAHVFFPEAAAERCTAALLLDVDPVGLVRRRSAEAPPLAPYVNDRPYAASSFLSVAIAQVLRSALAGSCREKPELAQTPLPLECRISAVPCRGGERLLRELFEPLGYAIEVQPLPLDERFAAWGDAPFANVTLRAICRVADLLSHVYVLIPVLDNEKHCWVGDDEWEKLLRHGEAWLKDHPARGLIARRFPKDHSSPAREALSRLVGLDEDAFFEDDSRDRAAEEAALERPIRLNDHRLGTIVATLRNAGAHSVVDLGCGDGRLLQALMEDPSFTRVVGVDVSQRALEFARFRLKPERLPETQRDRLQLLHGSLAYRDRRLSGFDAATAVEVIEHLDPPRLAAFERVLFEFTRARTVVVTTPNVEYNRHWSNLPAVHLRHRDHRFEWTRTQFADWANSITARFAYTFRILPIGPVDDLTGPPTQMAVFTLTS